MEDCCEAPMVAVFICSTLFEDITKNYSALYLLLFPYTQIYILCTYVVSIIQIFSTLYIFLTINYFPYLICIGPVYDSGRVVMFRVIWYGELTSRSIVHFMNVCMSKRARDRYYGDVFKYCMTVEKSFLWFWNFRFSQR